MSEIRGLAEFSGDGRHRRKLVRTWGSGPHALICMANPSTAGADDNDPTVLRLIDLLRGRFGLGGFTAVNWCDRIATDPREHRAWRQQAIHRDEAAYTALRDENLRRIRFLSGSMLPAVSLRIVAWGDLVPQERQTTLVLRALSLDGAHPLYAFGLTGAGAPKHPLARGRSRIPTGAPLITYRDVETAR